MLYTIPLYSKLYNAMLYCNINIYPVYYTILYNTLYTIHVGVITDPWRYKDIRSK